MLALGHWVARSQKRDRPEAVSYGSKTEAVVKLANQLGLEDRGDDEAVAQLVAVAGGRRRTLRRARQVSRFGGLHREYRHANRVYRLLDAACEGAVTDVDAEDVRRIAEVEAMMALSRDQRWALLVDRDPQLLDIEREVRSGVFGQLRTTYHRERVRTGRRTMIGPDGKRQDCSYRASDAPYSEAESQELRTTANNTLRLHRRVAQVVGPDSNQHDLLLRCGRARDAAEDYLLHCDESAPNT